MTGAGAVVAGAEVAVAAGVGAGFALCFTVLWWTAALCAGFFLVVVGAAVCVCGGVDAAGVELVCEADVPPQPATATAAAVMLSSARFMDPASILDRRVPF